MYCFQINLSWDLWWIREESVECHKKAHSNFSVLGWLSDIRTCSRPNSKSSHILSHESWCGWCCKRWCNFLNYTWARFHIVRPINELLWDQSQHIFVLSFEVTIIFWEKKAIIKSKPTQITSFTKKLCCCLNFELSIAIERKYSHKQSFGIEYT